jgi:phenylacetate-CoA ligase
MLSDHFELLRLLRRRSGTAGEIKLVQLRRLKALIRYAHRNVPYYRELFDSAGVAPGDIRSVRDLQRLPVTSRKQLSAAWPARVSRMVDPAGCSVRHTSGSSGEPLAVYRTAAEARLHRALDFRSMLAAGVRPRDHIATLGPLLALRRTLPRLGIFKTTEVSPLLTVEEQVECLREIQPDVFWVFPSCLRSLLQHIGSLSSIIRPHMIITAAEPLDEVLRRQLLADRPVELRNFYGCVEIGRIAWECAAHEGLHINTDCVIVELEDETGMPGAGKSVVVTNLNSLASPFIRYRLGDRCQFIEQPCSCGSPFPLMKAPMGREWDVIQLPSGRLISPWGCNLFLRDLGNLEQFRLIQERADLLTLQLKFSVRPDPKLLEKLRGQLRQHMGEPVTIRIEQRDHFDEETLKFRAFVSKVGSE